MDRGTSGTKRSVVTDACGRPIAAIQAPANRPDSVLIAAAIASAQVALPRGFSLVADRGYRGKPAAAAVNNAGGSLHITTAPGASGRWRVEATFAHLNRMAGTRTQQFRSVPLAAAALHAGLIILTIQHMLRWSSASTP